VLLECDLKTLRNKVILTHSPVLSAKILEGHTHLGASPHSIQTLVQFLSSHLQAAPESALRPCFTPEERDFLGELIGGKLSKTGYFKKAFELPGLRACVLDCVEELRLSGYKPSDLREGQIENQEKISGLREVFKIYEAEVQKSGIPDYPVLLTELIQAIQKGRLNNLLLTLDLIVPFPLNPRGMEATFLEVLEENTTVFRPKTETQSYLVASDAESKSLDRFKASLAATLEGRMDDTPSGPVTPDASLVLKAALTPEETLSAVFQWIHDRGGRMDNSGLVTPDYDRYAGPLYRFCRHHGLPLNLSHGLLASEFEFFAKDMEMLKGFHLAVKRGTSKKDLLVKVTAYFRGRKCEHEAYDAFRSRVLSFLQNYGEARKTFPVKDLSPTHLWTPLRAELESARISLKGLDLDRRGFFFGKPEDLIGCPISHLALLGLNDHCYPPKVTPNPILTDDERLAMNERQSEGAFLHDLRLSSPPALQKDLLEKTTLGVRKSLYLGFESHDLESGDLSLPSSFLNRVLNAFALEQRAEALYELSGLPDGFLPQAGKTDLFADYDRQLASQSQVSTGFKRWATVLKNRGSRKLNEEDGITLAQAPKALRAGDFSATAISTFLSCPYKFYLSKIAGLQPIPSLAKSDLEWLDSMQRGEFLHRVFELLARQFIAAPPLSKAGWVKYLKKAEAGNLDALLTDAAAAYEKEKAGVPDPVIQTELAELRETAVEFIRREIEMAESSGFYPILAEEKFEKVIHEWLGQATAGEKSKLSFKGTVDRLDTDGKGRFRVVDYKTGSNHFQNGTKNLFRDKKKYTHVQHSIYGLWATTLASLGIKAANLEVGYYYTSDKGGWAQVLSPYENTVAQFNRTLDTFHGALLAGDYPKNPDSCHGCDYRLICGGVQTLRKKLVAPAPRLNAIEVALSGEGDSHEQE
jgi:RecB family exonuclease